MPSQPRTAPWVLIVTLLVGIPLASPAAAAPFTATWHFDFDFPVVPDPSPFYDCSVWSAGGLICEFLRDQGLEVSSETRLPMYGNGNPFYDAFGTELPLESEITAGGGGGLLRITGGGFTPLSMLASAYTPGSPGGVFFRSSGGGLVKSYGFGGPVDFAGPEWTGITSMEVGIFLLDECNDPESGCTHGEQGLDIYRLTFDATPVPEPAGIVLAGTGLLAVLRRYRRSKGLR